MSTHLSVLQQTFLFPLSKLISFSSSHYPFPLTFPRYLFLTPFSFLLCPSHFPRHSVIIPLLLLVVLHHFPLFFSYYHFLSFISSPHTSRSYFPYFLSILHLSSSSSISQLAEFCIQHIRWFKLRSCSLTHVKYNYCNPYGAAITWETRELSEEPVTQPITPRNTTATAHLLARESSVI